MRVIEMQCEGCARLVRTSEDGELCGPCDAAMCRSCLAGTTRCPSCQKTFLETRDRPAVVQTATHRSDEPPWMRMALMAGLAIALGFAYVSFSGNRSEPELETAGPIDWARIQVPLSSLPCSTGTLGHTVPDGPLRLPDMLGGPQVMRDLLAQADAILVAPEEARLSFGSARGEALTDLVLVVDRWQAPVLLNNTGRLVGRVFLRRRDNGRIVCGADVDVHDLPGDPGSLMGTQTARVELVRAALEAGLGSLRATR